MSSYRRSATNRPFQIKVEIKQSSECLSSNSVWSYSQLINEKHKWFRGIFVFQTKTQQSFKENLEGFWEWCAKCQTLCLFVSLVALVSKLQHNTASVEVAFENKTIHVEDLVFTLWSSGFLFWISSGFYLRT